VFPIKMPQLVINTTQTIEALKAEFNRLFPFLKIEFFREPHLRSNGIQKNKIISSEVKLKEIQKIKKKGKIELSNETVVGQLEQQFENEFGLFVEVFRKSGNIWLETSATDSWTLYRQNEEGRMLEQHFKIERENPENHDMY
jgi:hypothetical protein